MPLESSLPTSVLKPQVGTVTDTNTLAMGFLPPIFMLIFMQTVLLSMLTQFIYAPSISLLRYNVTHRCATITVLFLPVLESLCPLRILFPSPPTASTVFQYFTELLFLLYLVLCPTAQIGFFHFFDSSLCRNTDVFIYSRIQKEPNNICYTRI